MTLELSAFPKKCKVCGRVYTPSQWRELKCIGSVDYGCGDVLEHRNCACGTTLVIALAEAKDETG